MKHLSEIELVHGINRKDQEAFDFLFEFYWPALIFLTEELIGKKDSELLVSNMFKEISNSEIQVANYIELQKHIYSLAITTIINYAKNQPFGMFSVIKIEKEAREQVLIADFLRKKLMAERLSK